MLLLIVSVLSLLVIALTMLFSAADLTLKGLRWNVRRIGFVLAGGGAIWLMGVELASGLPITLYRVCLHVGIALVLMTNPFQLPWHKWLWKGSNGGVA